MTMATGICWLDLGLVDYGAAFARQEELHRRRLAGQVPDIILFQENFPVITIGRAGSDEHLLISRESLGQRGIGLYNVSRGGDITYHGPGQLVISPILHLKERVSNVHCYVRLIEQVVIDLLAGYGIIGRRVEGASGVWVGEKKIAALGIAVRHGVTQHGVAINVNPDLAYFNYIVPCGLKNRGVTSLAALGVPFPSVLQVRDEFLREFSRVFAVEVGAANISCEVNSKWQSK